MPDKKIKALLVEDDPMILEMYKARMQDEGWEVFSTDRGSEAVELAKEFGSESSPGFVNGILGAILKK